MLVCLHANPIRRTSPGITRSFAHPLLKKSRTLQNHACSQKDRILNLDVFSFRIRILKFQSPQNVRSSDSPSAGPASFRSSYSSTGSRRSNDTAFCSLRVNASKLVEYPDLSVASLLNLVAVDLPAQRIRSAGPLLLKYLQASRVQCLNDFIVQWPLGDRPLPFECLEACPGDDLFTSLNSQ